MRLEDRVDRLEDGMETILMFLKAFLKEIENVGFKVPDFAPTTPEDDEEEEDEDKNSVEFWVLVQRGSDPARYFKNVNRKGVVVTTADILTAKRLYSESEAVSGSNALAALHNWDGVLHSVWISDLKDKE